MTKRSIVIETTTGPRTVKAEIFGPLAVNAVVDGRGYHVTHIASGCKITPRSVTLSQARKMARILAKEDWDVEMEPDLDWPGLRVKDAAKGLALRVSRDAAYKKVTGEKLWEQHGK